MSFGPARGVFSPWRPRASRTRPARCLHPTPHRASSVGCAACIRPRERSCAQQSIFCVLFTRPARPSTRRHHTFPARSNPVRPQRVNERPTLCGPPTPEVPGTNEAPPDAPPKPGSGNIAPRLGFPYSRVNLRPSTTPAGASVKRLLHILQHFSQIERILE
jgi:hypothetical protein